MKFPKKKRTVDRALVRAFRELPCIVCEQIPSEAHHVVSRGAGGADSVDNLMSLCRWHHQQVHKLGRKTFAQRYQAAYDWFVNFGKLDLIKDVDDSLH